MTDRKVKRGWAHQPTGTKGKKTTGQLVKEVRKPTLKTSAMTMAEKIECLDLYADLKDAAAVAVKMKRSEEGIRKFLSKYQSTTKGARMTLEAGAERLANRIIKDANVEESLEVLDRLDVVNKKRDKAERASHSILIVGMPGARIDNPIPLPSQKQIEEAVDAQVIAPVPDIPVISDSLPDV